MIDFGAIRERADLAEIAASYGVELRRAGHELVGRCPLHGERTPSFYVHPVKGTFYCFGCGAKGDALDFLRLVGGLTFEEALERVGTANAQPPRPRPSPPQTPVASVRDAAALWALLARTDDESERYLKGRGLLVRDPDVLRFNAGGSGDPWLDARARDGYRVAFAVRRPDGSVQTISLRYTRAGEPPAGKKTLALAGCSTKGAAIFSPSLRQLALGDPEFASDRILVVEGGTSWLGAAALFSQAAADFGALPTWPLGAIGVRQAAGVVEAFASIVRWRTLIVGLDADRAGQEAAGGVLASARRVGVREALHVEPPCGAKDWGELARMEYAGG